MNKPKFDPTKVGFVRFGLRSTHYHVTLDMVDFLLYYIESNKKFTWILKCTVHRPPDAVVNHSYDLHISDFDDMDMWKFIDNIYIITEIEKYPPRIEVLKLLKSSLAPIVRGRTINEILNDII